MRSFLRDLRGELPWLAPIGAMTVLTFILAICAGRAHQTDPLSVIWLYGERIVLITPVVALAAFTALTMICALRREASPVATIVGMVRTRFASPAAWATSPLRWA